MEVSTENVPAVNGGETVSEVIDDVKYGFQRKEMFSETLAGTAGKYDRHVFLCYKSPESWEPRVEASETELLPKLLASAIKSRKDDIVVKTMVTVCGGGGGGGEGTEFDDGDVLIFPDMIKYRGLTESNVDNFVADVLVGGKGWASGEQEMLTGSHIFVCAHASRDKRCGVCGPILIDNLKQEIATRELKDQIFVSPCSHIGGHKYAGNLIIYSPDPTGKITGHWYGYVTPDDVPAMLDQHIGKGEVIERLWRGQMGGAVAEEVKKEKELELPNGKDAKRNKKPKKPIEEEQPFPTESLTSCCQGANGVSCCKETKSDQKIGSGVPRKTGMAKISTLFGTCDQADVYTGLAVIGAVATIGVAYSYYRRSS